MSARRRDTGKQRPAPVTPTARRLYALDATVPRYPRRFRWRVIKYILFISLLAAGVAFGYSYYRQTQFLRSDRHQRGQAFALALAEQTDLGLLANRPGLVLASMRRVLQAEDVLHVEVYRTDGSLLAHRSRRGQSRRPPPPAKARMTRLQASQKSRVLVVRGSDRDRYLAPVLAPAGDAILAAYGGAGTGDKLRAVGFVRVVMGHSREEARKREILLGSIYLGGALLVMGLILAVLVAWRLSRPLRTLAAGADAIRQGNWDTQITIRTQDEFGQLADSFNRMVWKLRDTVDELGRLNRGLEAEINERTRDIRVLSDFVKVLNARRDFLSLVDNALQSLVEAVGASLGAIFVYNPEAQRLSVSGAVGVPMESLGARTIALGEGDAGRAAQQSDPVVVENPPADSPLVSALGKPVATLFYQPIRFGDAVAGVLLLGTPDPLSKQHREILAQAANQLAVAMTNARAFEAAAHLAEELEARNVELIGQTELLERQKKQLVEANRLKNELMANITHELRTPLNAVIGYAELMVGGAYGDVNGEQVDCLGAIVESARGLLNLITQILDMAKMDAGQMALVLSDVDIAALLKEAGKSGQILARGKALKVGLGLPESGLVLRTDEGKLSQIVTNLVSNAVKFTDQGRVDLIASRRADGGVQILVRDTGTGIEAADHEVIFQEFRQLDGSTTREAMGTGLGLAISRKFARLMGGDITVDSLVGKGSTFTVSLPAQPPERSAVDAGAEAARLDDVSATLGLSGGGQAPDVVLKTMPPPGGGGQLSNPSEEKAPELILLDDGLIDRS